ncbi:MgtE2 [Desulfamplus magnetovallimortis]|uniref:Magnesium transporter MgtE n=1 Tax=Desulfamplus magnetovallimortis TaxID=1246637 RepID=L0R4Y1_9BACT|nr:magnesium transporter [Desulfamplus magnetovallimortis]CCO06612.1 MgtE2 [Desulfamplus magnetovallimortis BW-1]SLM32663.1 MgtE2 [Desulfamplus magnetovallimortis]
MMQKDKNVILADSIKRLLRRGATKSLQKIIKKTHAADLSLVFRELSKNNRLKMFNLMTDPEQKGVLLSELEESIFLELIAQLDLKVIVEIFENMAADDVVELLGYLEEELADAILEKMKNEDSLEVEHLMSYGEDTAGSIMVPDFIAIKENMGASDVISALQNDYADVEMPFYIYVVDEYGKLVGVCSLRQLVVVHPQKPLKEFMATDIVSVNTYTDREDVAEIVARYDYLAVPVVDDDNRLVGIVTVDDVIDIISEEATVDILKMAGVGEDYIETQTIFRGTRIRLPWLFTSFLGGLAAFFIIGGFEASLEKYAYLAAFIPVIMGMGGNIGTQSSTIVVRGIATGRINTRDLWSVVSKELAIGIILGLVYGLFIGVVAKIRFFSEPLSLQLSISVCLAVISSMSVAALVGSLVPMLFEKVNIDPAVATGPFVTTSVDIVSVYCYFMIATLLLGI